MAAAPLCARSPLKAAGGDNSAVRLAPVPPVLALPARQPPRCGRGLAGSACALAAGRAPCGRPACPGTFCSRPSPNPPPTTSCPGTSNWPCWAPAAWARAVSARGPHRAEPGPNNGVGKSGSSPPGEDRAQGGSGHPLPSGVRAASPATFRRPSPGLAPLENEGRCSSRSSTCSHPRHQRHGTTMAPLGFAESAARSSLFSWGVSVVFDGPVRALHLIFLFHFQQ